MARNPRMQQIKSKRKQGTSKQRPCARGAAAAVRQEFGSGSSAAAAEAASFTRVRAGVHQRGNARQIPVALPQAT